MKRSRYFLLSAIICCVIGVISGLGLLYYNSESCLLSLLLTLSGLGEIVFGFMAIIEALMEVIEYV